MSSDKFFEEFAELFEFTAESDDSGDDLLDEDIDENVFDFSNTEEELPIFDWKTDEFIPKINIFDCSHSGAVVGVKDMKEIDFFKIFISESLVDFISIETNKQFKFIESKSKNISWRLKQWTDTNVDEMYVFFAVCILMAINTRNSIQDHWSTDSLLFSPIYSETMSRNRFQLLLRMLHFCDNHEQVPGDRLFKIRYVVNHLKGAFSKSLYPYANLCVDESMLLYKGRSLFRQYVPLKASRFGIKFFVMYDCATGYVLDFIIYTGESTEYNKQEYLGMAGSVVMTFMEPYLDRGHTLYVNGWYTTPILFKTLFARKTNACGIARRNRKGMPKLNDKLKAGELRCVYSSGVSVQFWKDKREVIILTTLHPASIIETGKISPQGESIKRPECLQDYNRHMGAFSKCDMILSSILSSRKTLRWYMKLFFHLLDLSLLNAHIIFMEKTGKRCTLLAFQLEVIRQLIAIHKANNSRISYSRKRKIELPSRLVERHFLETIPPTGKKASPTAKCAVCSINKRRKESRYRCKQCTVALCVVPCFETYHTAESY